LSESGFSGFTVFFCLNQDLPDSQDLQDKNKTFCGEFDFNQVNLVNPVNPQTKN
jgi:hypothetical protein